MTNIHTHYCDVMMGPTTSQITSLAIVYSIVYSGIDQRKHQSSASLAFVRGIHRRPMNAPHKWPVTRKMFPFDDFIMQTTTLLKQKKLLATPLLSPLVITPSGLNVTWWRHQIESFSALLAICAGNSPVTGEFPAQRPVTRSFDVFFDMRLNKPLNKQSWGWWFETPSRSLDVIVMK